MSLGLWIVIIGIFLVIFCVGIYALFYRKQRFSKRQIKKIKLFWEEIEHLIRDHPEQAILKADKLLDYTLSLAGFSGSLGEKLKKHSFLFSDINGLWFAHKLRNTVAHDIQLEISSSETKRAIQHFKRALRDIGVPL